MTEKRIAGIVYTGSYLKPMLIGALIAFLLMTLFLSGVNHEKPEWGLYWKIRPLLMAPFAGACGGLFYFLMEPLRRQGGWKMAASLFLCLMVYVFGLWMGTVLGLLGTLWN